MQREKISSSTLNRFNNLIFYFFCQLPPLTSKEGEAPINTSPAPSPAQHHSLEYPAACPHCWIFSCFSSAASSCCQAQRWLHRRHSCGDQTFSLQPSKHSWSYLVSRDLAFQDLFQLDCRAGLRFPCWPCPTLQGWGKAQPVPGLSCSHEWLICTGGSATRLGTMNTLTVTV